MMTNPERHGALAKAIMRLAEDDPAAFSAMHQATIAAPLVETDLRWPTAYAIAQRLVRNLAKEGVQLTPVLSGRGRVTSQKYDMRLKHNRPTRAAEGSA